MKTRLAIIALILVVSFTGCNRKKGAQQPVQPAETPEERRRANEEGFRKNIPVLDRTIVMQELEQIHLYFYTAYSASGKWPKDFNAAREQMQRDPDMRKLLAKVDEGTYVIVGIPPEGGILAYCTKETTVGFFAVTTNKDFPQYKSLDELKQAVAQQKR